MTALIKMWRFLEGILSPSAEKKGQAEGGTLYASRCDIFLEDVSLSSTQKKGCRSHCFIRGKTLAHRLALMANRQTMMWLLVKHKYTVFSLCL